jgi:hypothetical protein
MELLLLLAALTFAGVVIVVCGALAVLAQLVLWVILLPFRLLGALLFFPFWIAGLAVKTVLGVVILPLLALAALFVGGGILAVGLFALAAPFLILGLLFVVVVMIVKALTAAPAVA